MAEALLRRKTHDHEARSAGTRPADEVHANVVAAMKEVGADLSDVKPKRLESEDAEWADVVVTMGCSDECPSVPGTRYVEWELEDPAGRPLDEVRKIRDDIDRRLDSLLSAL
jgi:arsenate reductase (thioredoxin)